MSTSLSSLTSNFFPKPQNGFSTTLASTISAGATTVPLASVAGYTNGDIAVFVVDPTDTTKKQTFTGVVDTVGVQVTSVIWTAGNNVQHANGATVVDYATATHIGMISKGILKQHNQDGSHAAVTATSVTTTADVTAGGKVSTDSVQAKTANLNLVPTGLGEVQLNGTGISGAWTSWTPTWTGVTVGNGTVTALYKQIGKVVYFRILLVFGSTSSLPTGADAYATLPTSVNTSGLAPSGRVANNSIGMNTFYNGTDYTQGPFFYDLTTSKGLFNIYAVSGTRIVTGAMSTGNITGSGGAGHVLFAQGAYEAA